MLDREQKDTGLQGFGSANRSSYLVTHPTHACSEHFRRFESGRIARPHPASPEIRAFVLLSERAKRAHRRRPC